MRYSGEGDCGEGIGGGGLLLKAHLYICYHSCFCIVKRNMYLCARQVEGGNFHEAVSPEYAKRFVKNSNNCTYVNNLGAETGLLCLALYFHGNFLCN